MANPRLKDGDSTMAVTFKLPKSELMVIRSAAEKAGMNVSEYVRFAVRMTTSHSDPEQVERVLIALRDAERCVEALNRALNPPKEATVVRVDEPQEDDSPGGLGDLFG
jgi:hypothetical protein